MKEDIKVLEKLKEIFIHLKNYGWINDIKRDVDTDKVIQAIENLIKGYKELEEYQHKVNEILNLDDDNLDIVLIDNCQKGLKKCVTEFEKENQSYRDYFGTPPCYDNADYIPKSKVRVEIKELENRKNYKPLDNRYTYKEVIEFGIEELEHILQEGDK